MALVLVASLALAADARQASAYIWMVRHDHPGCVSCHMDPSGAGLLTSYGREEGEAVLPMRFGTAPGDEVEARRARFAWGLIDTPEWLLLGASGRSAVIMTKPSGAASKADFVIMQADARVGVRVGGLRASVSAGVIQDESSPASLAGNLVSREHWLGYSWASDTVMVRAGRLNVPFGLRLVEHTFMARQATRTDINDTQQHGAAFAFATRWVRGELMAIVGNYQIKTAANRDRGYSGYVEATPATWAAIGVSSLLTHAERDIRWGVDDTRQVQGLFTRVAPASAWALLAELDYLHDAPKGQPAAHGWVSLLQADYEPWQGLHLIGAGETMTSGYLGREASWGAWLGIDWFFWSHFDVRADLVRAALSRGPVKEDETVFLVQGHGYL